MAEEKQTPNPLTARESAVQRIRQADHIFIAYSHSDLRQAKNVQRRIVKLRNGLDPGTAFLDQLNLMPGEDVSPTVIDSKLRNAGSHDRTLRAGHTTAHGGSART